MRSATGSGISTYGLTMLYMKSWMHRIQMRQERCIGSTPNLPHDKFSFANIWLMTAQFEIRQLNLKGAREILGNAIGKAPKDKIFKKYIEIELQLGNIDRAAGSYTRSVWSGHLRTAMPGQNMLSWRYRCVKLIELGPCVFEQALNYFRNSAPELKEERAMLLEEWLNMEKGFGELGDVSIVQLKMPKKLKRKRPIANEDGPAGFEEYIDYVFPEENQSPILQILQKALEWKKRRMVEEEED